MKLLMDLQLKRFWIKLGKRGIGFLVIRSGILLFHMSGGKKRSILKSITCSMSDIIPVRIADQLLEPIFIQKENTRGSIPERLGNLC